MFVHIFTRDLNVDRNRTLLRVLKERKDVSVLPVIFINDDQVFGCGRYSSPRTALFFLNCVSRLKKLLPQLQILRNHDYVSLLSVPGLAGISIMKDSTAYAAKRNKQIERMCREQKIEFVEEEDGFFFPRECYEKADGSLHRVFTYFYEQNRELA